MEFSSLLLSASALAPVVLMSMAACLPLGGGAREALLWKRFRRFSVAALLCALVTPGVHQLLSSAPTGTVSMQPLPWLGISVLGAWLAVLVQMLGTVIAVFSSRYLQGETGQGRYVAALAAVLAAVHLLLLANHWLVLIAAWAIVGVALQHLLCFYPDRPFALLAAHKKRIADRLADVMLLCAAALAWWAAGSGSLADLQQHLDTFGASMPLQLSAVCVVVAVILRTALLPVHGWLIQVMEAPTPVSALLHAGVVNLGGFVLIRFAPLLEAAPAARWLLVGFGLATALLAGLVMLTRISIKVRLAWSTVAQMGFMVLECGLGLYTLAALHLIGHSLYKAHAFLSASAVVNDSKLRTMRGTAASSPASLLLAPALAVAILALIQARVPGTAWPWWWSGVLALAWAPMLWLPTRRAGEGGLLCWRALAGLAMVAGLTAVALAAHALPFGLDDAPQHRAGVVAMLGMGVMYLCLVTLQVRPQGLAVWRRWSYAGFYVDELYTRLALRLWPARWSVGASASRDHVLIGAVAATANK
ncbi:NADH-quinone oxidoreductase subunit L [Azoarcus sp. L1K30]|uniref:NADH-quinone oxidoreductase subunit L n=1 Tax=Azoarcus sp. L1K30 TaxID=2820277 RepID=UPI001B82D6B1|nr:NADH-quinone oxidoreductase subunit L [Azoarcus sp. L1K30]MBR0568219.1 NADH-quinone oxidoreductase subunit L [Azoarcus sp. L1K30]